jgi:molybdopterin-biosynthesis enzyme MoeA-like protein
MTLKGISKGIRRRLRPNEEALLMIKEHYARRHLSSIEMTPSRKKMATLPIGARPVRNEVGTAPGVRMELAGTTVFCLPGVPSEMKSIFRESVEPEITKRVGKLYRKYISLKIEGIYESALAPTIESELKRHPGAYIKSHPRGIKEGRSRIELDVAVVNEDKETAEESAAQIVREMKSEVEAAGAKVISERGTAPVGRK